MSQALSVTQPARYRGVVLSDLHLFARRTRAEYVLSHLHAAMAEADVLVLNGDIFDFRWTTLASVAESINEAAAWVEDLAHQFPHCRIHYVQGNHDCASPFVDALSSVCNRSPTVHLHEDFLVLGDAAFLHGDCVHWKVALNGIDSYRRPWKVVKKKGNTQNAIYDALHQTRLTVTAPKLLFSQKRMAKRITDYLESREPGISGNLSHVFLGHTHVPFINFAYRDMRFHNTGCALDRNCFNLLKFEVEDL